MHQLKYFLFIPFNWNIDDIVELPDALSLSVCVLVRLSGGAPVLLSEESHQELAPLAPVEGGRDDDIPPRGQHQPGAHLPQVDVLVSLAHRVVTPSKVSVHLAHVWVELKPQIIYPRDKVFKYYPINSEADGVFGLPLLDPLGQGDDQGAGGLVIPGVWVCQREHVLGVLDKVV